MVTTGWVLTWRIRPMEVGTEVVYLYTTPWVLYIRVFAAVTCWIREMLTMEPGVFRSLKDSRFRHIPPDNGVTLKFAIDSIPFKPRSLTFEQLCSYFRVLNRSSNLQSLSHLRSGFLTVCRLSEKGAPTENRRYLEWPVGFIARKKL